MDPDEALRLFREANKRKDSAAASSAAQDIVRWIDRGGFLPSDLQPNELKWVRESALVNHKANR